MSSKPFFSIVITTYNRAHIIAKALDSVLAQTYDNYEVIIVDNRSSDNIEEVLEPYIKTGKVHFHVNEQNFERAVSRNNGMKYAKGDFLTLLDSDDIIYPNYLEAAAGFIQRNSNCKVFHSLYNLQYEDGTTSYKIQFPKLTDDLSHLVNGNYLSCHGVFMSKEVYKDVKFDEEPKLIGHEDYDFWLRVVAKYGLCRLEEYNSAMLTHETNSMKGFKPDETLWQKDYLINKYKNDPKLSALMKPFLSRLEASIYVYAAVQSNFHQDFDLALKMLRKSFQTDKSILFTRRYCTVLYRALLKKS